MTARIFKTIFGTAMLVLFFSLILLVGIMRNYIESRVFAEMDGQANYIAVGIEQSGLSYFSGLTSTNRITYIAPDGTVLFDSVADASAMENHSNREEFIAAQNSGHGSSTRFSETLSQNTLYYALRLDDKSIIRIASTHDSVFVLALSLLGPLAGTILIAAALSFLLAGRLAGKITKPILSLDLEHPEDCETYDELSPLLLRIHYQNETIQRQLAQLRKSQEEFAAITENMSEGFLLIDRKTNLLSHNSSALRLLGTSGAKTGQSVLNLARGESFRKVIDEALSGKHSEALMRFDKRCYQLYANAVFNKAAVVGAVIAILDVTEREERDRLRREFTANVSHELKTPLTSISGFAEIMMNRLVAPENIPEFAGDIYNEAQRLITLVDDIIHLSQLDEGVRIQAEKIDLCALSGDVLDRLHPSADKMEVALSLTGDHAEVTGVMRIVDEIIYNLCENAIKYNKRGGSVNIDIREDDSQIRLSVADTGIGIPTNERERVFERFYRVDKSHSKEIGGTGLGLSIVKHGCVSQGISLALDSTVGLGSTITLIWKK